MVEHLVFLKGATKQGKVAQIKGSQVNFSDGSGDRPGNGVPAAGSQHLERLRELGAADHVDHHVDGSLTQCSDQVRSAVDGLDRRPARPPLLPSRLNTRDHRRTAALGELHGSQADPAGGTGDQHPLRADRRPVQHVLRCRVGARHGGELCVAQITVYGVGLSRGRDDELREPTVTVATESPALERPVADGVRNIFRTRTRSPMRSGDASADPDDAATDVRALDAGELQRGARPTGVGVVNGVESGGAARTRFPC